MLQYTKTKSFRICAVIVLLIALYAAAGFWLAPRLVRSALMEDIPKAIGATPAVGEIHINPFLFQVELKDFSLASPGGEKLLGFQRLFVDFELSSIWHRAFSFVNIDIGAPYVNAVVSQDGALNLLQLRPKPGPPKPQEKDQPIPAIRIGSFKVSQGLVSYEDRSRPSEFAARLQPINFELQNFTTGVDGGRFTFTGESKLGERVEWHGHLSVQPIASDGEFQVSGLQAHTIWEYLEDKLNFAVNSGSIDVNASYKFQLKDSVDLNVDVSKVALSNLTVRPKDSDTDWVTLPELLVSGTHVDLLKRQAHVDTLSLSGLKLVTWLEPDGSVNLMKLGTAPGPAGASAAAAGAPAPPATSTPPTTGANSSPPVLATSSSTTAPGTAATAAPAAGAPWQFDLGKFELREGSISGEDRGVRPAAKVVLAPLSIDVEDVSLDLAKPLKVKLDTRVNETGAISISGDLTPQPVAANLGVKLTGIDLTAIQPYIGQKTSMTLLAGKLSADTQVKYGSAKPVLQLTGSLSVSGLHTVDNALHDDFINWDRLDIKGLNYQQAPDRLDIEEVLARKMYARVIIEPDTTLNATRVLAAPGATVIVPAAPGSTAAPVAVSAPVPESTPMAAKTGNSARKGGKKTSVARAASGPGKNSTAKTAAAGAAPAGAAMPMSIKKITVQASQANFADLSVTPNFSTGIQKLEGTVLNLSSKPNSRAKIDLHGSVDAFSPVAITGEVNVLGTTLYTDLALSFRNMELSTFNPYSGKFAGYNISKGKLTTELHYKIDGRKLDAQHHIIVDQLEFGAKTESKEAVSLPIKLAVALLKDKNGVIDLSLPITGSLDDPKFRLAPIIWKVFVNILEKAVTAPFALLGSLFGGGPDLQFIDFDPGVATLDPSSADKVGTIVKALNDRPQLKIEVPIAAIEEVDRPALIEAQFAAEIHDAQASATGRKKAANPAVSFDQMDPAAKVDLLTPLYEKTLGGSPKYPDSIAGLKGKPEIAAAKADFLSQALHDHIAVDASSLTTLGQQRAMAVQQLLLKDTQIDPARVFLVANDKAKKDNGKVRLELSLQ